MKWIFEDGMVYPACTRCGAYPLVNWGKDEHGHYLVQCPRCGKVVAVKTHPNILALRAAERWSAS